VKEQRNIDRRLLASITLLLMTATIAYPSNPYGNASSTGTASSTRVAVDSSPMPRDAEAEAAVSSDDRPFSTTGHVASVSPPLQG
jgi:hypothetical protein